MNIDVSKFINEWLSFNFWVDNIHEWCDEFWWMEFTNYVATRAKYLVSLFYVKNV
jgi:hypothetical protein